MTALLAGPIVRRSTDNRVCVWVATRNKAQLKLTILASDGDTGVGIGASSLSDLDGSCCKLGENLYVYLLKARPHKKADAKVHFPKDQILYYRIGEMDENNAESIIDLAELGLTYGGDKNPSFVITQQLKHLLHGSCRKIHGLEVLYKTSANASCADGLSYGDDQMSATHGDIESRPSVLLMTGDQIYADDVPSSVMAMLTEKAKDLIGFNEEIPPWPAYARQTTESVLQNVKKACNDMLGCGAKEALTAPAIVPADILPGQRKNVVIQTGFTTERGENHLLSFGEFAAMYLYVFGNAEDWVPDHDLETKLAIPGREQAIKRFHETLRSKVRRLLANICTYMIFDDHDVTDDWNITGYWYAKVRDSDTGRRVVANALAAYWAFQGWGNDPDHFDKDLKWVIEKFVQSKNPSKELGDRYDLQLWKHRGWGFSIPTVPPIVGIDSRTQRQPDVVCDPPQLLDRYALDNLRVVWQKLKTRPDMEITDQSWPLFIATTPVMGVAPVEGLQRLAFWLTGLAESYSWIRLAETLIGKQGYLAEKIIEKLDAEAWVTNRQGYVNFLATLAEDMGIKQCIFLSGDVHYSFSAKASFQRGKTLLNCLQLNISPLCNSLGDEAERLLNKADKLVDGKAFHGDPPILRSTWKVDMQMRRYFKGGILTTDRTVTHCCLGLVELKKGVPVKHSMLTGASDLYYELADKKTSNSNGS